MRLKDTECSSFELVVLGAGCVKIYAAVLECLEWNDPYADAAGRVL